jgi:hypothetical protein
MTGVVQSAKRELEPLTREAALDTIALAATPRSLTVRGRNERLLPLNDIAQIGGGHERVKSSVNRRNRTRTGNGRRIRPDRTNR